MSDTTRTCLICFEKYEAEMPKPLEAKVYVTAIDRKEKTVTFSSNWPTTSIPFTEEEQEGIKAGPPIKYSRLSIKGTALCGFCTQCREKSK